MLVQLHPRAKAVLAAAMHRSVMLDVGCSRCSDALPKHDAVQGPAQDPTQDPTQGPSQPKLYIPVL